MTIHDPCGSAEGYQRILGIYGKYLANGYNWRNRKTVRSKTLEGYFNSVNALFHARNFQHPVNFQCTDNQAATVFRNAKAEEDVANRRSPITNEMYVELIRQAREEEVGSELWVLSKIASLAKIIGPRACEFAQKTISKVEMHQYPSGRKVVKAFIREDFTFFDKSGKRIKQFTTATRAAVKKVKIRWRIQKNRQNGQVITVVREFTNDELCSVLAAWDIYTHSIEIGQTSELPMVATLTVKKEIKYLTGSRIATLLRQIARKVHPDLSTEEINKFSAHSLRVWACVLLSEAGAKPDFIKARLRWLGDSYQLYLRDTAVINEQHRKALEKSVGVVANMLLSISLNPGSVPEDTAMGDYTEFE